MNVGILGGGFGLYGYVPALIGLGHELSMQNSYRSKLVDRVELRPYLRKIDFREDAESVLSYADSIVIAKTPQIQSEILATSSKAFKHLFLEKPLGENLIEHTKNYELLIQRKDSFSIGYLFLFCEWFERIESFLHSSAGHSAIISWEMEEPAGWKANGDEGGGIFQFYAIHAVAMIQAITRDLNGQSWNFTKDSVKCVLQLENDKTVVFEISYNIKKRFSIIIDGISSVELVTPFGESNSKNEPDHRIPVLSKYLVDALSIVPKFDYEAIERNIISVRKFYNK